jgi:hypothetical protein
MSKIDINDMFTYDSSTAIKYQAITGDAASTKSIDLGANGKHHFSGKAPVYLNIRVNAAFNTLDSLEIAFESDSASDFTTSSTKKQVVISNIARANLTAGKAIVSYIIPDQLWQRYVRLYFNVVGSNPSTGSLWAWLSNEPLNIEDQIDLVGA